MTKYAITYVGYCLPHSYGTYRLGEWGFEQLLPPDPQGQSMVHGVTYSCEQVVPSDHVQCGWTMQELAAIARAPGEWLDPVPPRGPPPVSRLFELLFGDAAEDDEGEE